MQTKYLVSWPNTWEPEDNLENCPELLEQFEAGLPQSIDVDDDNSQSFPSEWVVEQILERRYDENGNVSPRRLNQIDFPKKKTKNHNKKCRIFSLNICSNGKIHG